MSNDKKAAKAKAPKPAKQKGGGIGIREQMMIKLLPTVIIALVVLTTVSAINSKKTINSQVEKTMNAELAANSEKINADLEIVRAQAKNLAREVEMHVHALCEIIVVRADHRVAEIP